MKKYLLWAAIPVILGSAFFVYRIKGSSKTEPSSPEGSSSVQANYSLVSKKSWDGKKNVFGEETASDAAASEAETPAESLSQDASGVDPKIKAFIALSGMDKKLLSMNSMLEQQIEMLVSDQSMREEDRNEVMRAFKKNFDGKKLLAEYSQKLRESFSDAELEKLSAIYSDPHVVRFNQLNNEMSDPSNVKEFQDEFLTFMKNLDQNVGPERKKIVAKIDVAMDISGQASKLTMEMFSALSAAGSEPNELEQEAKKEFQKSMKEQVLKGLMFTLKDFPDQDAQELVQVLDPRLMQPLNAITGEVLAPRLRATLTSLMESSKVKKSADEAKN